MRGRTYAVTVPAESRYLKVIRAFLESVLKDLEVDGHLLVLALDEACSNIIKHRQTALEDNLIRVRAEVLPGKIRFHVGDFCGQEDVPNIRPRKLTDIQPGGLGTHFIDQIMDRVAYAPDHPDRPERLALVLEKSLPNGEERDGAV